jgi:hypothetical protein
MRLELEVLDPVLCCFHRILLRICDNDTEGSGMDRARRARI